MTDPLRLALRDALHSKPGDEPFIWPYAVERGARHPNGGYCYNVVKTHVSPSNENDVGIEPLSIHEGQIEAYEQALDFKICDIVALIDRFRPAPADDPQTAPLEEPPAPGPGHDPMLDTLRTEIALARQERDSLEKVVRLAQHLLRKSNLREQDGPDLPSVADAVLITLDTLCGTVPEDGA